MGWDISYHPISEQQINEWYFDVLNNESLIDAIAKKYQIDDFYKEKYRETIQAGERTKSNDIFDKNHGYFVAVTQGFFQKYFYIRGAALSFIENEAFHKYYKPWSEFVPNEKLTNQVHNRIIENYCSGVYIPKDKVVELLNDYENDSTIQNELEEAFSHERINVLLNALNFAKENNLGLLEATEVIEPNPVDLNKSSCYSNLMNCDPEGALLYRDAAMEQFADIAKQENMNLEDLMSKVSSKRIVIDEEEAAEMEREARTQTQKEETPQNKPEKKSFWKKLFGK